MTIDDVREFFRRPSDDRDQVRATALAWRFIESARVATGLDAPDMAAFENTDLPAAGVPLDDYWDEVERELLPRSPHTSSPRFIGHMTSALPHFVQPLSRLTAAMNQNMVKFETATVLTSLERQVLGMLHRTVYGGGAEFYARHLHDPGSSLGCIVTGGTGANITALWCARNDAFPAVGDFHGVERDGMAAALAAHDCRRAVVLGSALMHYSFDKAAGLLGLGTDSLLRLPTTPGGCIDVDAVARELAASAGRGDRVMALVAVAGTTDCGSIDALSELAALAAEARVHLHVDAAWAGPLLFSTQHRHLLAGIELADSVTIDGHKQLYQPVGVGMVLFKDPALAGSIEKHADYIIRSGSPDLGRRSLEGSRPAMALGLHATLQVLGTAGIGALVDEGVRLARWMADEIEGRQRFELLVPPQTNILLYRFVPHKGADIDIDRLNAQLQERQLLDGRTFVSRTRCQRQDLDAAPITALRAVLANPLTSEDDIAAVLDDQETIAAELLTAATKHAG
jgi:glutamate decarboxylase